MHTEGNMGTARAFEDAPCLKSSSTWVSVESGVSLYTPLPSNMRKRDPAILKNLSNPYVQVSWNLESLFAAPVGIVDIWWYIGNLRF